MNSNLPVVIIFCLFGCYVVTNGYKIGVGRADCTGPPVEVVFVSMYFVIFKIFKKRSN